METYFVYSDEYGAYVKDKKQSFLQAHPYYIRAAVILNANEWKNIEHNIIDLKRKYSLPIHKEIKWNYLWSLRSHKKSGKVIKNTDAYYFLKDYDYHDLIKYVDDCLAAYNNLNYKKILYTITENSTVGKVDEQEIYKMHLMNIAQRLQYEYQSSNDLTVLYLDSVGNKVDDKLKNAWNEIYCNGDFVKNYSCIKSSAYIEYSHQSVGVQISDYVAGVIGSYFKSKNSDSYQKGVDMYLKYILPNLRKCNGKYVGGGVLNVPTQQLFKQTLKTYYGET